MTWREVIWPGSRTTRSPVPYCAPDVSSAEAILRHWKRRVENEELNLNAGDAVRFMEHVLAQVAEIHHHVKSLDGKIR